MTIPRHQAEVAMSRLPTPSSRLPVAGASRLTAASGVVRATPRTGSTAAGSTLKRQASQVTMTAKRGRLDTSGSEWHDDEGTGIQCNLITRRCQSCN